MISFLTKIPQLSTYPKWKVTYTCQPLDFPSEQSQSYLHSPWLPLCKIVQSVFTYTKSRLFHSGTIWRDFDDPGTVWSVIILERRFTCCRWGLSFSSSDWQIVGMMTWGLRMIMRSYVGVRQKDHREMRICEIVRLEVI